MPDNAELTPLHVMLELMRRKWGEQDCDGALNIAKAAAPYVHPRAARPQQARGPAELEDDELGGWMDVDLA